MSKKSMKSGKEIYIFLLFFLLAHLMLVYIKRCDDTNVWNFFFAGNREGGEQECDHSRHPDGPHTPDVPTKSHSGKDQTPRHPETHQKPWYTRQHTRQPDKMDLRDCMFPRTSSNRYSLQTCTENVAVCKSEPFWFETLQATMQQYRTSLIYPPEFQNETGKPFRDPEDPTTWAFKGLAQ